jgi:hypothetical protein
MSGSLFNKVTFVAGIRTVTLQTSVLPFAVLAVILVLPPLIAVTLPLLSTAAMVSSAEDQVMFLLWVVLAGETVAVSADVLPAVGKYSVGLSSVTPVIATVRRLDELPELSEGESFSVSEDVSPLSWELSASPEDGALPVLSDDDSEELSELVTSELDDVLDGFSAFKDEAVTFIGCIVCIELTTAESPSFLLSSSSPVPELSSEWLIVEDELIGVICKLPISSALDCLPLLLEESETDCEPVGLLRFNNWNAFADVPTLKVRMPKSSKPKRTKKWFRTFFILDLLIINLKIWANTRF